MRLIDGDSTYLQDAIGRNAFKTRDDIRALIDRAPTVNAVIVTRCKDCKYLRVWNQKDLYAFCPKTNFVFLPFQADTRTHFCSLGEPKET